MRLGHERAQPSGLAVLEQLQCGVEPNTKNVRRCRVSISAKSIETR